MRGLVVVDEQNTFCEGGELPVVGGKKCVHDTRDYIEHGNTFGFGFRSYRKIVATKDWHNREGSNGGHFHASPDFKNTWPVHGVAGTYMSELAAPLVGYAFDEIFHKGWDAPAFSGFQGQGVRHQQSLDEYLKSNDIDEIDVIGIATDHCVEATVFDGLTLGYVVNVLAPLTVAVSDKEASLARIQLAGAQILR